MALAIKVAYLISTNTRVQKDMSNKSGISRKHMRNNEIYMCQHEASTMST
ncbi:hypothetical protein B296_00008067 [Ensete ventricosum]|uniref:Uncharacterized protein n=1 Tax=Ensete ventricosum TaxID=4639 RepID=A0A426XUM3_ENSVE|nr:hypothetical protein B296_00008067 [Ensete ventricosum]